MPTINIPIPIPETPAPSATRHVVIRLDGRGGGSKVTLDGRDVPGCFAVKVEARVGRPPVVTFSVYANRIDADVRALVEATTRDDRDATVGDLLGRVNAALELLDRSLSKV